MKAYKFLEINTVFAEDNPEYKTFAYVDPSPKGNKDIVICYTMTFMEKLMIILTGKIWVNITSGDGKLRPMRLSTLKQDMLTSRKQRRKKEKAEKKLKDEQNPANPMHNGMHVV